VLRGPSDTTSWLPGVVKTASFVKSRVALGECTRG
jgi:hypothetical protein